MSTTQGGSTSSGHGSDNNVPDGKGPWTQVRESVEVWQMCTPLPVDKRAAALAMKFEGNRGMLAREFILANKDACKKDEGSTS